MERLVSKKVPDNLPAQRFSLLAALVIAMPWMETVEALPTWDDRRAAAFAASRTVPCPHCKAASGKRCTGLGAQDGHIMRMHHGSRLATAARTYCLPSLSTAVPPIPYKVRDTA